MFFEGGWKSVAAFGRPIRKWARTCCPGRDNAARCGAQVPGRKDASHGAGGRSGDRAFRFRRGAALLASGSGLRGGAWRAGRANRRGGGAGAAQAVSQADQVSAVCKERAWASSRRACIGKRRRGCSAPRRRLALPPTAWPGPAPVNGCALRKRGPSLDATSHGRSGQPLSAGRSRERAPRPVHSCFLAHLDATGQLILAKANPHPARLRARLRRRYSRFAFSLAIPLSGCVFPARPSLLRERSSVAVAPERVEAGLAQRLARGKRRRGCSAPRRRLALPPHCLAWACASQRLCPA